MHHHCCAYVSCTIYFIFFRAHRETFFDWIVNVMSNGFQLQFLLFLFSCAFCSIVFSMFLFWNFLRSISLRFVMRWLFLRVAWHRHFYDIANLKVVKSPWHYNRMEHIIDLIDPTAEFNPIPIAKRIEIH